MIPVVFMSNGGTNQQLKNSAVLLQANNLALNDASNETCAELQSSVISWARTNLFHNGQLYVLQLKIRPSRCEFQTLPDGTELGMLNATLCQYPQTMEACSEVFEFDCIDFCRGWLQGSEEERTSYLMNEYGVRPSVQFSVTEGELGTLSLPNGEVMPAYFSVQLLYSEAYSVKLA